MSKRNVIARIAGECSVLNEVLLWLQRFQERTGELFVNVMPENGYGEDVARRLHSDVASKLQPSTVVEVRSVDELEKMRNGKLLLLISRCAPSVEIP